MRKMLFVAAAAASFGAAAPAFAQDAAPTNPAFTGLRVEGLVGYDNVSVPGLKNPQGVAYGVGVGYDFSAGGVLLGIEAEASDSTASKRYAPGLKLEAGRDLYVGARVGTVIGGRTALYVKGGYTNARVKATGIGADNFGGWRLGAGAEYALGTHTFLKAEYRYSNYKSDVSRNQLVGGFGFRF